MLRFLFKLLFFLVVIFIIASFFANPSSKNENPNQTGNIDSLDTFSAIRDTIFDLGNFCNRNSETCTTGKAILNSVGERVRTGAKVAYDYLGGKLNTQ